MLDNLHRQLVRINQDETPAATVYGTGISGERAVRTAIPGSRFHCPICGGWYRCFLPFGLNQRRHARCPGCGSLERHRFLWLYLKNSLRLTRRRSRILHVAPEPPIRKILSQLPNLTYLTIDLHNPEAARQMDLTNLAFDSAIFDIIICSHVLEHIENDRNAMREMARVLRPNGRAVILVPVDPRRNCTYEDASITAPSERLTAFGHPYHVRICGIDYANRISDAGFHVKEIFSTSLMPHRRRLQRINKTVLYDCHPAA
ncbi:MAG: methyltransferase domain-containing protein [Pirellulaceae bacterium]|nr:methyltransferase domain-containing protein [Pirellulaceae bacterium]